jgi:bifunctional ADP-heptose synthase (sugar kinase/adenylyltransferase)
VIILSDYNKGSLVNVAEMIRMPRARRQDRDGRPEGRRFHALRGATMLTPNKSELKRIVGSWKTKSS